MFFIEIEGSQALLALFGKLLNLIYIAVPILLIVVVSIDLLKAIASQDNEMVSKAIHSIKKRLIACLAIFFMPTIVELLFSRVFISLNMDEETYKEVLSTYKSVINSEKVDVTNNSKSNQISSGLEYSVVDVDTKTEDDNEFKFSNYSKTLSGYIFSNKSLKNISKPLIKDDFVINYKDNKYNLDNVLNIKYKSLEVKEAIDNGNYVISTITLKDVQIDNDKYNSVSLNYYYAKEDDSYKLSKVDININDELNKYNKQIKLSEKTKEITSVERFASSNSNYDYSKLNKLSDSTLKKIYDSNSNNLVRLSTVGISGIVTKSTGFFIGNGLIVTSWSYLQSSFMMGNTITVLDISNNPYKLSGVVLIDSVNDYVVLKLNKNVNRSVTFGDSSSLSVNDPIVAISSKSGLGFSAVSGIVQSNDKSIIGVLPTTKTDWGCPIIDSNGKVVGVLTSKIINSELSNSSPIEELKRLQGEFNKLGYKNIKSKSIDSVKKDNYYKNLNKEQIKKSIPKRVWKKYKKIGDVENSIGLDLIKASYYDGVVSLRYSNPVAAVNNLEYASEFITNLKSSGFKNVFTSNDKLIFKKGNKQVILIDEFDYLIVVIVKGGIF